MYRCSRRDFPPGQNAAVLCPMLPEKSRVVLFVTCRTLHRWCLKCAIERSSRHFTQPQKNSLLSPLQLSAACFSSPSGNGVASASTNEPGCTIPNRHKSVSFFAVWIQCSHLHLQKHSWPRPVRHNQLEHFLGCWINHCSLPDQLLDTLCKAVYRHFSSDPRGRCHPVLRLDALHDGEAS